jgi:hypothetical protein
MSERLGIPSTKYGPSVCCGVPWSFIDEGISVHVLFVDALIWDADSSTEGGRNGREEGGVAVEVNDDDVV